ncbi:unnamed protein product [Pylaiella littoralis]
MDQDATGRAQNRPRISKKRTNPLERTLAILVQSMRGNKVVVEMKNDTEISGILEETDRNMNGAVCAIAALQCLTRRRRAGPRHIWVLSMVDVRQTNPNGTVRKMDTVLVQGKMIRYVHIPDEVDAISNLQQHMKTMDEQGYRRQMLKAKRSQASP